MIKNYFTAPTLLAPESNRLAKIHYVILAILLIFACFYGMSSYAIFDMKEGIFAEVAREMVATNSYIIPHLNFVPFLQKPPLFYWLVAASYHFFGVDEFATRLIPSIATALTGLLLLYFGKKIDELRAGWLSAIILFSSAGFTIIGRVVSPEILTTLFISASLFFYYIWYVKNITPYLIGSYFFLSLAVLTDGLFPLILVPTIGILFIWLTKSDRKLFFSLFNKTGLLVLLALSLPWFIIALLIQSGFVIEYFINVQLLNIFSHHSSALSHPAPGYFYIPWIIAYLLPWSLLLPTLFRLPQRMTVHFDPLKLFLWLWFIVAFVFLSLSFQKNYAYMIVSAPALAFLFGLKIEDYLNLDKGRMLSIVYITFLVLEIIALIIFLIFFSAGKQSWTAGYLLPKLTLPAIILLVVAALYLVGGVYLLKRKQEKPFIAFLLIVALIIPSGIFASYVKDQAQLKFSQFGIGQYVNYGYEQLPIYFYQDYEKMSSLPFYAQQHITLIDNKDYILQFGQTRSEAKDWFLTLPDFLKKAKGGSVYVAVGIDKLNEFQNYAKSLNFCTIMRSGTAILLSNSPEDCKVAQQQLENTPYWENIQKKAKQKGKVIYVPSGFSS